MVSWSPCFESVAKQSILVGRKAIHLMVAKKHREKVGPGSQHPPLRAHPSDLTSFHGIPPSKGAIN